MDPDKFLKRSYVKMGAALMVSPLVWESVPLVELGDWIEALGEVFKQRKG